MIAGSVCQLGLVLAEFPEQKTQRTVTLNRHLFSFSLLEEVERSELANQGHNCQRSASSFFCFIILCIFHSSAKWSIVVAGVFMSITCVSQSQRKGCSGGESCLGSQVFKELSQISHPIVSTLVSLVTASFRKTRKYTLLSGRIALRNKIRF